MVNPPAAGGAKARKKATADKKAAADPALGLFHLGDDPGEANNLAAARPELVRELQAALTAWQREVASGPSAAR